MATRVKVGGEKYDHLQPQNPKAPPVMQVGANARPVQVGGIKCDDERTEFVARSGMPSLTTFPPSSANLELRSANLELRGANLELKGSNPELRTVVSPPGSTTIHSNPLQNKGVTSTPAGFSFNQPGHPGGVPPSFHLQNLQGPVLRGGQQPSSLINEGARIPVGKEKDTSSSSVYPPIGSKRKEMSDPYHNRPNPY